MQPKELRSDYEMFTPAGNRAVKRMIIRLLARADELDDPVKVYAAVRAGMDRIARRHAEVWDTEPRYHINNVAIKPIAGHHGFGDAIDDYF